ncbi:MAG: aminoacyl-tRNA hydrolase [bacterium]|jgi:PTH1 family peptidyl-tRNA hydrolase
MWCLIGLGNPGSEYESTPHNVGFEAIDRLSVRLRIPVHERNPLFHFGSGDFRNNSILLVKPMTFMNRSGNAYKRLLADPDITPQRTLIILDDIHIPLGKIRIRMKGSHGGHNGLRSIIEHARTEEIPRIRIGVGGGEQVGWVNHVLGPFSKQERQIMDETLDRVEEAVVSILFKGLEKAMNLFNR